MKQDKKLTISLKHQSKSVCNDLSDYRKSMEQSNVQMWDFTIQQSYAQNAANINWIP